MEGPPPTPDLIPLPPQLPASPAAVLPAHGPPEQPLPAPPRLPRGPAPVALPGEEHGPATRWREHAGRTARAGPWRGGRGGGGMGPPHFWLWVLPGVSLPGQKGGGSLECPRHHGVQGPAPGLPPPPHPLHHQSVCLSRCCLYRRSLLLNRCLHRVQTPNAQVRAPQRPWKCEGPHEFTAGCVPRCLSVCLSPWSRRVPGKVEQQLCLPLSSLPLAAGTFWLGATCILRWGLKPPP